MRSKVFAVLMVATVLGAILYGIIREDPNPWKVVGSTSLSPRLENLVARGSMYTPHHFDRKLVEDYQVVRDFNMPWNRTYDFYVVISTFRYEERDRIGVFFGGIAAHGGTGGRQMFADSPDVAEPSPVEAQLRIKQLDSRYHYFYIGWVNCPDVQQFTLKLSDGHEVTLNAEEEEFFILHMNADRLLSPPPAIEEIVVEE